jgi:protein-S-isoprenylcysteine O-methyltransferase Ste14
MTGVALFDGLVIGWLVVAVATFVALFFVVAPYGRHRRSGWGPTVGNRLGWIIMEAPAVLVFTVFFALSERTGLTLLILSMMWGAHYIHRAFIYPLELRGRNERMPLVVVTMALAFNLVNAGINGYYLFFLSGGYPSRWLLDARFVTGAALFILGFVINRQADLTLLKLRAPGHSGYKIPYGGLYRWVSCPNYLGEIVEWVGWALATWSLPGLAFAVWTMANLAPRARTHHIWYHERFPDYPSERRALLPGLW